jgi:hypothetical protein
MNFDEEMEGQRFFPPYKLLLKATKETRGPGGELQAVTLPVPILAAMLREAFLAKDFNEEDYLSRYPDVRESVSVGRVKSGLDHFVRAGFFEGRLINYVRPDEHWYRERNIDVMDAIEGGRFESAEGHYIASGAGEGRAPTPELEPVIQEWVGLVAANKA